MLIKRLLYTENKLPINLHNDKYPRSKLKWKPHENKVWQFGIHLPEQSYWTVLLGRSLALDYSRQCSSGCPRSFLVAMEIN